MGLATRIIPTILCCGRVQVKGERFNAWRTVGLAEQAVQTHQMRGVDEIVLLDIMATLENRGPDLELVRNLAETCFSPFAVGGGVRSVEDVRALLAAGADKVVIGTAAYLDPALVQDAAAITGAQAIVVSVDVKNGGIAVKCGTDTVHEFTDVSEENPLGTGSRPCPPEKWAKVCEAWGAGEILLQSIDRDGTLQGYDLNLIHQVSQAVNIPVIASGGCGTYQHMLEAIQAGASAVAAGAMFQFTDATPSGAARYLQEKGIEVRV